MTFLQGLHGTVAAVLILVLLFVDETGLPLPFAPNEALLLLIGVLVAGGEFTIWVIVPMAFLAMLGGMITGYGWARAIGQTGLLAIAERVHATKVYERAQLRLKSATWQEIALARLVPGLRPYATLVSGAAEVDLRMFLFGAIPALVLWEVVLILAGMLVGLPLAHLLGRFEKVMLRGGVLVALGAVAWLAIRDASPDRRAGISRLAPRLRATLALVIDAVIVASFVMGAFAVARHVVKIAFGGWIELVVAAGLLIVLLLVARARQTPGERLFETHYWHHVPATSHAGPDL